MENKGKKLAWKFKYLITIEKGLVCTRNNLDLKVFASDYYWFQIDMETWVLNLWQDKKILQIRETCQYKEGLLLNHILIPVHWQEKETWQEKEMR